MKAVILAGGLGTRLSEVTESMPKPMVSIGERPILWHIMKIYSSHGITDFVICLGYKGYVIKEYFANYQLHVSDVTVQLDRGDWTIHAQSVEPWRVTLVDTGLETMTGGRLKRVARFLDGDDFCLTYGDGVGDVDISGSIDFHRRHGGAATMTVVRPPGRFGAVSLREDVVTDFREKPVDEAGWINGGFFVLSPKVLDYIEDDQSIWEHEPLRALASHGELRVWKHTGFWQMMDTMRDLRRLESLWLSGEAPWRVW